MRVDRNICCLILEQIQLELLSELKRSQSESHRALREIPLPLEGR